MKELLIKEYKIESDKLNCNSKIAVVSDLHNKVYKRSNEELLDCVKNMDPDIILITGDLVTSEPTISMEPGLKVLKELIKIAPVYYGMGNHEKKIMSGSLKYKKMKEEFCDRCDLLGVHPLSNELIYLGDRNVTIEGLDIDLIYYSKFYKHAPTKEYMQFCVEQMYLKKGSALNSESFRILIAHNPEFFPYYKDLGADLILSGHLHGGVIRLPGAGGMLSPAYHFFPKYDGGKFVENDTTMIVSRGLGMHTLPFRINNPAELSKIELISRKI